MKISLLTKPTRSTILLFAIFVTIVYFANVQTWGFCKECGIPKPFFYDIILLFGFWFMGVVLTFPVGILFGTTPEPLFMIIQIAYVYVLSATLVHIRKTYLFERMDKLFIAMSIALFLFVLWDTGLFRMETNETVVQSGEPFPISFYFGYVLIPTSIFIFVYGTLLAGAFFYVQDKVKKR